MVIRGKHKAHALLRNTVRNRRRGEIDIQPQSLQHIGAAAFAADAAPAVLADFGTGCCGHKHGACRDVEGVRTVATGTHDINQVRGVSHLNLGGELAHHLRSGCDFANGFFFDAQACHQRSKENRRHLTRHDLAHEMQHLVMENFTVLDGALQRFLRRDSDGVGHGTGSCRN